MNKDIATIKKNSIDEIRIALSEFKGYDLINIHVYTEIENGKDMVPTKKGLTCNVKLLPDLIAALQEAEKEGHQEEVGKKKLPRNLKHKPAGPVKTELNCTRRNE